MKIGFLLAPLSINDCGIWSKIRYMEEQEESCKISQDSPQKVDREMVALDLEKWNEIA